jgi:hypothetical protein
MPARSRSGGPRLERLLAAAPAQLVWCPHTTDPVQAQQWSTRPGCWWWVDWNDDRWAWLVRHVCSGRSHWIRRESIARRSRRGLPRLLIARSAANERMVPNTGSASIASCRVPLRRIRR